LSLRAGTRGSALARRQTELAIEALRLKGPSANVEVVEVHTEGDRDQATPLSQVAGRGVFTSELEAALLSGEIDFAVHSLKDLPTDETTELTLAAILKRGDARDAVVSRDGMRLDELARGSRVGTSSSRRAAQLRLHHPALEPVSIRGNVDTRIRKLRRGEYDAIVLAAAGLARLDRLDEATQVLGTDEMLPAPGQGAIALQCRASDIDTLNALRVADHSSTAAAVTAERSLLAMVEGGCSLPVAAYGEVDGPSLRLRALIVSPDGETAIEDRIEGMAADPETAGRQLAGILLAKGAGELLQRFAAAHQ
jgi:hydroxymethylbilane synthase